MVHIWNADDKIVPLARRMNMARDRVSGEHRLVAYPATCT